MKLYSFNRRKIYFMCIALVMAAVLLMGRLAYLMVAKADYYDSAATQLHERERSIKAPRGNMTEMATFWLITRQSVLYLLSTARLKMRKKLSVS